jgi:hypothetical protein
MAEWLEEWARQRGRSEGETLLYTSGVDDIDGFLRRSIGAA